MPHLVVTLATGTYTRQPHLLIDRKSRLKAPRSEKTQLKSVKMRAPGGSKSISSTVPIEMSVFRWYIYHRCVILLGFPSLPLIVILLQVISNLSPVATFMQDIHTRSRVIW